MPPQRSDAEQATAILAEEGGYRWPAFTSDDAVTLGLSIRKRFRASSRHSKGKGLVISIQTISGQTLFACTVGELGHVSGVGDVSLDSWACLEEMITVVKKTGHSSHYVEKGMGAMGKTARELGLQTAEGGLRVYGGAFPIWLEVIAPVLENGFVLELTSGQNTAVCPIAVVGVFSGSSVDDHTLVVHAIRDYLLKFYTPSPALLPKSARTLSSSPGPHRTSTPTPAPALEYGSIATESAAGDWIRNRRVSDLYTADFQSELGS